MRWKLLIVFGILLILAGPVQAEETPEPVSALQLIESVVQQLNKVKDFKGAIRGKVYGAQQNFTFRTKVMKSPTRFMIQNVEQIKISNENVERLLNTVPWLYLPPSYSTIIKTLPVEGQLNYQEPLKNLAKMYEIKLLGEAIYQQQEVYIIQLRNKFSTQRFYLDKKRQVISRIEVFNSSNIRVVNIDYKDFKSFAPNLWLPTKIKVKKALGSKLLEVNYHDWKVNIGLTDFDFIKGFQEDYQAKVENLNQQLKQKPQNVNLYWQISQIYKENNKLDKAVSNLRNAIRINDRIKYRKELTQLLQNQGRYKAAIGEAKAALRLDHNNAQLYYLLGELHLQLNNSDKVQYFLEKAVSLAPKTEAYLEKLFWVYYNSADSPDAYILDQAQNIIQRLISLQPKNEDYRIYLGNVYFRQNKLIKSAKTYQKAIDLAPRDTWGYVKLAQFYQATDNYYKAEELYRYIIYLNDSLRNHRRLANLYFEYGKYKLALNQYQLIDERTTHNYQAKLKLAETYFASNRPEQGLALCQQILRKFKQGEVYLKVAQMVEEYNLKAAVKVYYQALQEKSVLNAEQENKLYRGFNQVFWDWTRAIRQQDLEQMLWLPIQGEIYQLLGKHYLQTGNPLQAVDNFKSALKFTSDLTIHSNLVLSYLIMGNYQKVKEKTWQLVRGQKLEKAHQLLAVVKKLKKLHTSYEDEYIPGRINRLVGDRLRRQGDLKQAVLEYKQAVFENYNYKLPYFYLAWIYHLQGNDFNKKLALTGVAAADKPLLQRIFNLFSELERQGVGVDAKS